MDTVPEGVAVAQPILYLFVFTVLSIVGGNLWFIKWLAGKFLDALGKLAEQNAAQTALLVTIEEAVERIEENTGTGEPHRRRRKRGMG